MEARDNERIETPRAQRLAQFNSRFLPAIVWTVSALIVGGMLIGRASRLEYIGLAQATEYPVATVATGTVDRVFVDLYDRVAAGDMLATLDDSTVLASMSTANASLVKLQAELEAERARLLTDEGRGVANWEADLRRFIVDEEQRRLDLLKLKVEVESREIDLERLELETRRAKELWDAGVFSKDAYELARLRRDGLRQALADSRRLMSQTEEEYQRAHERRSAYEQQLPTDGVLEALLGPLREAIEVESRRLDEIELQRAALTLRSPIDGRVVQILARRHKTVMPGEPVVVIADESVREIVAFLHESDGREIAPSTPVMVSTRGREGTVAESVVLRVGPTVQQLPERLWRNPRIPDYGRAIVIAAAPGMKLTPGERVNVKILSSVPSP
jgi:multidrug resistance efflux pump